MYSACLDFIFGMAATRYGTGEEFMRGCRLVFLEAVDGGEEGNQQSNTDGL